MLVLPESQIHFADTALVRLKKSFQACDVVCFFLRARACLRSLRREQYRDPFFAFSGPAGSVAMNAFTRVFDALWRNSSRWRQSESQAKMDDGFACAQPPYELATSCASVDRSGGPPPPPLCTAEAERRRCLIF